MALGARSGRPRPVAVPGPQASVPARWSLLDGPGPRGSRAWPHQEAQAKQTTISDMRIAQGNRPARQHEPARRFGLTLPGPVTTPGSPRPARPRHHQPSQIPRDGRRSHRELRFPRATRRSEGDKLQSVR